MNPLHEKDQEEFDKFPAPLWEALIRMHTGHINATLPFYGPLLYFLVRSLKCRLVVEIGVAEGYSSYFLANAVTDNQIRLNDACKYIGIEINPRPEYTDIIKQSFPCVEYWTMNSLDVIPEMFEGKQIDLLFQDGCHETDHCLKELEIFYPLLKDKGEGYIIMHDVYYLCEEYFDIVSKDPKYKFEFVRFGENYGLAICRKMDGYDYSRRMCEEAWIL